MMHSRIVCVCVWGGGGNYQQTDSRGFWGHASLLPPLPQEILKNEIKSECISESNY